MGTIEQRKEERFAVEVAAEVYTQAGVFPAFTRNLSKDGVCLDLSQALDEGILVGVSLFVTWDGIEDPDSEPLNLKARVIWASERDAGGFSAGARFEDVNSERATLLEKFLKALG